MDPLIVFCPNRHCPARGQLNQGNIHVHSRKDLRYRCSVCRKTFTESTGTLFYRLHHSPELVTRVVTLLAFGCPLQAIVAAFALDERTVASWQQRAGQHCQAVQEKLVEVPRDLGHVQIDEIRVKRQGGIAWMGLALMVSTRLWLGGVVGSHEASLTRALLAKVRACASALCAGLLFCTDGWIAYVPQIRAVFREKVRGPFGGRPRLQEWPRIWIAQAIKQSEQGKLLGVERRVIQGSEAEIAGMLERTQGGRVINTAFIERLNATFRQCLATLARRSRAIARKSETLEAAMNLVGTIYNFCCEHESLRLPGLIGGHKWLGRTPAMAAGISEHRWSIKELLSYRVAPSRWQPVKRRGGVSNATKALIARWCQ